MADRLELEARFNDRASAGVKRLGKTLGDVKPSNGMAAAQKWMGEFRGAAEKANVAVRPLATGLSAVGIGGLAASLSMSELVKQFKDLADSTLSMKELGRQSRMSATEIARLQYAASKLHVDPAAVGGAISSWSSKMVEFRRHTGRFYTELLRQNSDVARKIASDSPVDALKDTLDFLSRIKDPQIQKRWAEEAGLGDLTPMLGKGPQGLAEAFADAAREVKPISSELQAAADRFNDATNRFNQSWLNLKNDIGPSVLDPLGRTIDKLDDALKFAAQYPGDAAAAAATIAGSLAAFWLRARIMRGSKLAGAGAAGAELAGAAREQVKAGDSLLEAAVALKEAAAELRARGAGGGLPGTGPAEDPKKTGGSFDKGRGLMAALGLAGVVLNAPGMDEAGDRERDANSHAFDWLPNPDALTDRMFGKGRKAGDAIADWLRGSPPTASDKWKAPSRYEAEARARVAPDSDLKKDVQDGSKAGIIAGLRELAQQQELGGEGGSGGRPGAGGALAQANRVLQNAGRAVGAHFTPASGGGTTRVKGALAANQREAYAAALKEGLSPTAARALVANMSGEGLAVPGDYHWDSTHMASGIVQWDPTRSARIKAQFGAMPHQLSVADQTRAAIWEMKTRPEYAETWRALHGDNAANMIGALVDNYERPKLRAKPKAERMGYYRGFNPNTPSTPGSGTPTPSEAAQSAADAFKARQKALLGGAPGHAAGGAIRGPGGPRSDSIPAWLSNGEFVVNARASGQWLPFLHAINAGHTFADGGQVDVGLSRRRSWLNFFQRRPGDGGMGAPRHVALGATAMMMGESGRAMDPSLYGWDVNGPSGGTAQWHDVTRGRYAGKLHRLSDLMTFAMQQHEDWHNVPVQQAFWKREATGPLAGAWRMMRLARTAAGTLRQGINRFENPAQHDVELARRMPNIVRLARETNGSGETRVAHEIDPIHIDIRHHPHTGKPIVQARAGKGVRLGIKTGPTMRPT